MILLGTANYKLQRDVTQKYIFKGYGSCTLLMLINICMKLHEGILNGFLSNRADTTISQNLLFSISKGHNSKNMQSIVTVLAFCTSSHVALHLCKVS